MPYGQGRDVRRFAAYRHGVLTTTLEDRPGQLRSTAGPPPEGLPQHPFLHGSAYDTLSEHELGTLLGASHSFDEYLSRLIAAGYDIASLEPPLPRLLRGGLRLYAADELVGVVWGRAGQLSTLTWQPQAGELQFPHATVTVYRQDRFEQLRDLLAATASWDELREALVAGGYQLAEVDQGGEG